MGLMSMLGLRRVKLTDGSFWSRWLSGETYTDKVVTPESAMHVAAAWACVRLLSETIGILPVSVYRRGANGARELASQHWLHSLVHDDPNADQTAPEFWEAAGVGLNLQGNALAEKIIGREGRVLALQPIDPALARVSRDRNGARRYTFNDRGKLYDVPEDKVFHVRGFGAGGDWGLSPISYARNSLGIAMSAEEAAGKVFAQGLQVAGFVTPKSAIDEKLLPALQALLDKFSGSKNTGKVMGLPAEFDFKQVTMSAEDAQLLASRAWSVEEVCRWWRVPPFMIGHTEKTTSWGTGLEQQLIAFLTFSLQPYLTRIEKAIRKQLLPAAERVEALLRADSAARAAFYSIMVQNGIYTRNDVRRKENLPPEAGGDVLTVQSALVPLDQLGVVNTSETAINALRNALIGHNGGPSLEDQQS
jgi:HK97 family phage portal protein